MQPRELLLDALQTALRFVPWPTEPGLRRVGTPGPTSPVLVTGNYDLTVRHVMRALRGRDAWLVVAPSKGINVWCAAAGGHLSTHQIVTALKTSGIEQQVRHRRAILPQLAATGVLARDVTKRCGWRVRFGPVYAEDLPRYLDDGARKSDAMRRVRFDAGERLAMGVSFAAPTGALLAAVGSCFDLAWALPAAGLASLLSLSLFFVYDRFPAPRRLLFGATAVAVCVSAVALGGGGAAALAGAAAAGAVLGAVLTYDHAGSTPIEGGSHFEERRWQIHLDLERCRGVYSCWEVCPEACFEKREDVRKIELAHDDRCVRCGACIVQCPMDALHFQDQAGRRIEPDVIRRFKLNLLGKRSVDAGAPEVDAVGPDPRA
jgi:NAD-dependent dihydropyrimidine dehydrogenase PreA subunit